jgi:hypothetical protein
MNVVGSVMMLTGHRGAVSAVLSYTGMAIVLYCLIPTFREYRASKKRADTAGLELVDVMCEATFRSHVPAGGDVQYCRVCPGAPAWPCSQYLYALSMSNEPEKAKLKFLRRHVMIGLDSEE